MTGSTPSHQSQQIELHKQLAPRYAYRYSFEFSRLFQQDWHGEMISHVPQGSKRILDLGCGTGFFLAELEERHPGSVGLDISHAMLKVSDQYVPDARLVTGDAEKLPFQPGVFDVVFCKGSLHHTRDHVGFLTHCRKALHDKPNHIPALMAASASAALLGRQTDAERAVERLVELIPGVNHGFMTNLIPCQQAEDTARWAEGFQKAGLPA